MKKSIGTLRLLSCIAVILSAHPLVQAGIISDITPFTGSSTANWGNFSLGQAIGQFPGGVDMLSAGTNGNPITVTFDVQNGVVYQQGVSGTDIFDGGFTSGESLLNTNNSANAMTITFTSPVKMFGIYVEEFDGESNDFTATISTTSDGGGLYTAPSGKGIEWVGLQDTSGAFITTVTLSTSGPDADYFLVGTGEYGSAVTSPVPEPRQILLLCIVLAGLGWTVRNRVRA